VHLPLHSDKELHLSVSLDSSSGGRLGQRACVSTQHTSNLPRGRGVQAASWVTSPAAAASAAAALSSLFLSLSRSRSASPSGCSAWARHQLSVLLAHAVEELCDRSRPCEGVPPRLASAAEDVLRVVRQLQRVVCCAPPATTSKREREREWNRAGEGIKWSKRGRPRTGKRPHAARQVLHDDEDHLRRQHRCTAPRPHKEVSYRGGCGLSQRKRSVGAGAADVVGPRSADGERTTLHWAADKRRERVLMQLGADKRREREGCWRSDGVARGGRRGAGA
jgi:hypothetical protein